MTYDLDVAVIGGGPAGLAAAWAAKQKGAQRVWIFERDEKLGGILQQCIHNGFGLHYFGEELTGPEYAQRFIDLVRETDTEILTNTMVLDISPSHKISAVSREKGYIEVYARAIVLAMGCRERTRGALMTPGTRPAGIFTAGSAQRLVNMEGMMPGSRVLILGSGDIGLIMARRMVWEGAKVEMVCEVMPYSSGLNRNIVQCLQDNNIPLYFNTTVIEIHGQERLTGVTIAEVDERRRPIPGTERFVECDTLLLSVGLIPENELTVMAGVPMDRVTNGAVVDETRQTEVPGVFACGNVLHVHDLVDNVSEEALLAGRSAAEYAAGTAAHGNVLIPVIPSGGVRYTVPQHLHADAEGKVTVYFRVSNAYKPAVLTVLSGGKEIARRRKPIMTPGEMEHIEVDMEKVADSLTLHVEEA